MRGVSPEVPNRLAAALAERRARGLPVLDLTESNPTRVDLPYPGPEILAALGDPAALRYEPAPFGLPAARAAVAAETGAPADRVVLTASTSEAYAFLFKLLCEPGDEVLIPQPSYPLFEHLAALEHVAAVPYPLRFSEDRWEPDLAAAAVGPRTRALCVVHPNNPTGSFLKRGELEALRALAARHDLALISDEVFLGYGAGPDPERAGPVAAGSPGLAFSLGGLSKQCGLPQLKLGWIVAGGPEPVVRPALERLELIADTFLSVGAPVQVALPGLLALGGRVREAIRARVARNRAALAGAARGHPVRVLPAEGGWYALLRVPATRSEEEAALELLGAGVLAHPGYFFDLPFEGALVLSLLPAPAVFDAAVATVLGAASAWAGVG